MREIAKREDITDLILDAVDVLLAKNGYKKMTMEDLARHVGIGKGTIYLHFRSKEEVTLSHIDRIVDRLLVELGKIRSSQQTPPQRIQKMLITRVLFRFDAVQHYTQSLNDLLAALRPALLLHRQTHFEKEAEIFASVLEDGRKSRVLRFTNAKATAHALLDATNSLLPYSLSVQELGQRKKIEKQVTQLADLMLNGLLTFRRFTK